MNKAKVSQFRMTAESAEKQVRTIAQDANKIIWGDHTLDRMGERGITTDDVLRILRTGWVDDPPELTEFNEWKCKVTVEIKRGRVAGVVTIILLDGNLFLKTVEWEDYV